MIQLENLSVRRGDTLLFDGASCQIHAGQKIGLTGANGCGKSSLFAVLRGEVVIDKGDVKIPKDWVIAHVAQEAPADQQAAIEHVLNGDQEWRELDEKIQQIDHPHLLKWQVRFEEIDGYAAKSRAAQLLYGLGFSTADHNRPACEFSGGWRVRLNVAKALMCRSDLLLLDEPTNHLDLDAVLWLERWLKRYTGTLILIAHDRDFLDQLTSHTLHIENQRAQLFKGNYSAFEKIRSEQLANQQAMFEKQKAQVSHMQDFVRRFRAKATKAKQAQSRLKALEKMEQIAPAHVDSPFNFHIPDPEKNPSPLLSVHDIAVGYDGNATVSGIEFAMSPGDRIGLIGPNGAGKSTVIKMLAGLIKPLSGNYHQAKDIRIGYFAQHQIEQLHLEETPFEHLKRLDKDHNGGQATETQLRRYLGSFGFSNQKALSKVRPFSGGEKSRLALALLCYQKPNLLLLDEPTNHLDIEMRQALAVALQAYSGAVVLVSHDRHLLKVNSDTLILVADGRASEFRGSVDDYPQWLSDHKKGLSDHKRGEPTDNDSQKPAPSPDTANRSAQSKKDQKRLEAEQRQRLKPITDRIRKAEQALDQLNKEKQQIETKLADNTLYSDENKAVLRELIQQQTQIEQGIEENELAWMTASEELDAAKAQLHEA